MTRVIKIGGAALSDASWLRGMAEAVAHAAGRVAIVHGGGPEISALSERIGVPVVWQGGRRITPPEALDVASMVLSGRLNKRIVAALLDAGADALGLSGEDGGLVLGALAQGGSLGRVGVVERVRAELLEWLMARGMVPVISPIARGPDGLPLNINADEVATAVAKALSATELLFITDVAGVADASGVRRELTVTEAAELVGTGVARDGMALKVGTALAALESGVASVRIGRSDIVVDPDAGTRIRREAEVLAWR
jgi:acetylglutamate kinase